MSRFLAYHERIGGCNIYCRGNLHAGSGTETGDA